MAKAVTQTSGVIVNLVVFLTVNHRGPLPLRELHSTDETIVWRDPGGSWACLLPVYKYQWVCHGKSCDTDKWRLCKAGSFSYGEYRGPLPLKEFHSTDETIVWRDLGGSWACLLPVYKYQWVCHGKSCDTDKWRHCKSGSFSYGESPRTPPLEGTSLHRWNNSVERPWGILSLFTTSLQIPVSLPWQKLWHRQVVSL